MVGLVVGSFVIATVVTIGLLARRSRRRDADEILQSSAANIDVAMTARVMPPTPQPAVEAELDLAGSEAQEPVIVLLDPADTATKPMPDTERDDGVDLVLQALIDRVRTSRKNVVAVVSEMVDSDLDAHQLEAVLTHVVGSVDRGPRRREELTLSGDDVPHRPGQLSAFAELSDPEKRRVIIRVLCLLVAQSEDRERDTDVLVLTTEPPTHLAAARDLWPGAGDADAAAETRLPTRRRLVPATYR